MIENLVEYIINLDNSKRKILIDYFNSLIYPIKIYLIFIIILLVLILSSNIYLNYLNYLNYLKNIN